MTKNSFVAEVTFKAASKIALQKTAEATGDFICNKVADRTTKA